MLGMSLTFTNSAALLMAAMRTCSAAAVELFSLRAAAAAATAWLCVGAASAGSFGDSLLSSAGTSTSPSLSFCTTMSNQLVHTLISPRPVQSSVWLSLCKRWRTHSRTFCTKGQRK